jgi:response regulator RpfG family c-di-GMP phosphodiesterase
MDTPTGLEFLLVSNNYKTLTAVTEGMKQLGMRLSFVPSSDSAREYIGRRKVDGVFVDLEVPGSLGLIHAIRTGSSNRMATIFACVSGPKETTAALTPGANFALQKPLTAESVVSHIMAAQDLMVRERRRYFRHDVNILVTLKADGIEQQARMSDLGEGGMAVRVTKPLARSAVVDFTFELSLGQVISGKGVVAWASGDGAAGIKFQFLRGKGQDQFQAWLLDRARIDIKPFTLEPER